MGGRPAYTPTDEDRRIVERAAGVGLPFDQICHLVLWKGKPLSIDTLKRYFEPELARGRAGTNERVLNSLVRNAVNNDNVQAQIFWAKSQCGFRENQEPQNVTNITIDTGGQAAIEARLAEFAIAALQTSNGGVVEGLLGDGKKERSVGLPGNGLPGKSGSLLPANRASKPHRS